jgi:hypothetical protein
VASCQVRGQGCESLDRIQAFIMGFFPLAWAVGSGQNGRNSQRLVRAGSALASHDFSIILEDQGHDRLARRGAA